MAIEDNADEKDVKGPFRAVRLLFFGGLLPAAAGLAARFLLPELYLRQEPLNSSMEAIGAFSALSLATLFYLLGNSGRSPFYGVWVSSAMLSSGILKLINSFLSPGASSVLIESAANLLGGFFFACVWLPERLCPRGRDAGVLILFSGVSAAAAGAYLMLYATALTDRPYYAISAQAPMVMGALAGALFFLSSIWFVRRYTRRDGSEEEFLATVSLIFGEAYLLSPASGVWEASWWLWRGLSLSAYLLVLWYALSIYIRAEEEIKKAKDTLEERVTERMAELTQEIAERRKAEKSLHESESRLAQILEAVPIGLFVIDRDGRAVLVNSEAVRILGKGVVNGDADSLPEAYQAYLSGTDRLYPAKRQPIARALKGESSTVDDMEIRQGEKSIPLEVSARPVYGSDGGITHSVAAFKDISERKRSDALLLEYTQRLEGNNIELMLLNKRLSEKKGEAEESRLMAEAANRAKSDFLANMSHELRTPLNSIIGFSEMLSTGMAGPLNEEQKEYLNDVLESGRHLLNLINDILDLSKVEAGKMSLEATRFNLGDLIESSIQMFREKAMKHGLKMRSSVEGGMDIEADEMKIKQVLFNLLSNAVKFTPDGGSITVTAGTFSREGGRWAEVAVEDTGIGIPEEDRKRLFVPFSQLESSLVKKFSGTGLGLSLCRKMVELHGGAIRAEGREGQGSRFVFTIPASQAVRHMRNGAAL